MSLKMIFQNETHLDKIFTGQKAIVENLFHKTVLSVDEVGTVAVGAAGKVWTERFYISLLKA